MSGSELAAGLAAPVAAKGGKRRGFLGHPVGLAVLFATEGFGGFAYYGLLSILVVALASSLLLPSHASAIIGLGPLERWLGGGGATPASQAALIVGTFGGLYFAAPLVGGIVADRFLGHTRAVVIGLSLLFVGYVMLTVRPLFLFGLLVMLVGGGLAGTTKAQLGAQYDRDDPRRSNGFQIYAFSTLIAVVFAPLVCSTLAQGWGWSWGFAAAAVGGLLALLAYLVGRHSLRRDVTDMAHGPDNVPELPALTRRDWLLVAGLLLLLPVLALNSVGNQEITNGYLLWAQRHYDLSWRGHSMPVGWLLSIDAFISMGSTAISVATWTWLEKRGRPVPDLAKITIGTVLCLVAVLVLAAAPAHRVGLGWGLAFHALNDVGNTNTYMVSMALYSRLAPLRLRATVTNACALQIFLANMVVAQLASRLDMLGSTRFWLTHAILIGLSAAILAVLTVAAAVVQRRGGRVI